MRGVQEGFYYLFGLSWLRGGITSDLKHRGQLKLWTSLTVYKLQTKDYNKIHVYERTKDYNKIKKKGNIR